MNQEKIPLQYLTIKLMQLPSGGNVFAEKVKLKVETVLILEKDGNEVAFTQIMTIDEKDLKEFIADHEYDTAYLVRTAYIEVEGNEVPVELDNTQIYPIETTLTQHTA